MSTSASTDLTHLLHALHQGAMETGEFMSHLLDSQVFMPVTDSKAETGQAPIGFQKSDKATPLILNDEEGTQVMILFSDPERSKSFLTDFPQYDGGFIAEVPWVLERLADGMGVSINPDGEDGIDLDPDTIRQLAGLYRDRG